MNGMDLRDSWEAQAAQWIEWAGAHLLARKP
jgi:hypothetical protein